MSLKNIKEIIKFNNYGFIYKYKTKSTMLDVKNFLEKENKNCIILSKQQTQGKGRRGSEWQSPKGNIYSSISFSNFLTVKDHYLYNILICASIKQALEKFNAKNIFFKWPNDIFYKNKKFSGIISEIYNHNKSKSSVILGFGINIENSPKIKDYPTTYAKAFCDVDKILNFFLVFINILFANLKILISRKNNDLTLYFKENLMFLNEKITIEINEKNFISGKFLGINEDGSLKLYKDSKIINIYSGRIVI